MAYNEYELAEKLKNRFYLREKAIAYASTARPDRSNGSFAKVNSRQNKTRNMSAGRAGKNNTRSTRTDKRREVHITPGYTADGELIIKNRLLNPLFVACLVVVTLMLLSLVMCFSSVYQTANEVTVLEKQYEALKSEEEDLAVRLDAKNDMRKIETIATTKLGMVKEDSIQKRFVSLSEGEHIDLVEDNIETEARGGVLLSSVFASIGKFFDKLK